MQVDMDFVGPGELADDDDTAPQPAPGSLLARIRERRDALAQDERLDLPIPSWGGDLVATYRVMERRQVEKLAGRAKSKAGASDADTDFLIRACAGVQYRDESGDLVPLVDDGGPVRFDSRLAALLGVEADTARDLVRYLFRDNAIAIGTHTARVVEWMTDTSAEVDGSLLGER